MFIITKNKEVSILIQTQLLQTSNQLRDTISALQKDISAAPDGHLICCHHGKYCKWYQSDGHTRQYIPKSDRSLAEQLALKTYHSHLLQEMTQEKKAIDSYLRLYPSIKYSEQLLQTPGYADLLSKYFRPISDELNEWMNCDYEKNPSHPEHLIHKTLAGHFVRSKSEAMIDSLLYTNKIPFRYEDALTIDHVSVFPDFTIRHPKTGKVYYWEHFGLMDDTAYSKRAASKLQLYISHGIIPSIHLITTYETQQNPLTAETIQKIIQHYFIS